MDNQPPKPPVRTSRRSAVPDSDLSVGNAGSAGNLVQSPRNARSPKTLGARRLLTIFVAGLSSLAALGLVYLLVKNFSGFNGNQWQLALLAGLYAATAVYCAFALTFLYPKGFTQVGMVGVRLFFGLVILGTAALLSGLGFSAAIIYLIFSLIASSVAPNDRQANLSIVLGIFVAGLAALAGEYTPFQQVSIELISVLTPAILGVLFMIYVTMQAMQFVTATLRVRLVTIFMAIVIVPLAILSLIQSQFLFNQVTREAYQSQMQASEQAAFAIDQFIADAQKSLHETAQFDIFTRYLELPPEKRKGSPEEQEMRVTLKVLDANELKSTDYLSSFGLLNLDGMNIYDTLNERISNMISTQTSKEAGYDFISALPREGSDESQETYFVVPARSGVSYTSQVQVLKSNRSFFYISAPIRSKKGEVLGVLRARYDGQILQDLLRQYSSLTGSHSYAILLDDNNIRLADQYTPENLYKAIAPLPADKIQFLQENHQLPYLPANMLSTDDVEFNQLINNYEQQPVFIIRLLQGPAGPEGQQAVPAASAKQSSAGQSQYDDIAAVAKLNSMPWKVVYLRTDFNEAALRREQGRLTTLVTIVIAGIVGLIAVGAAQLLAGPIMRLTQTAQSISGGDLEAQAPVQSSDEFGILGAAFNSMTAQLRALISQLEDRVKARTQEIEKQNQELAHRAAQLQTLSDVARQIVTSQELEALLSSVTRLISDRFGFYHVGVFLVDEKKEYAVLRAANSEGGQRMLDRQHALPIGRVGIVGFATGTGQARIATDVGEDATYFNNPDLPDTRSEMALPLKVADQVIGALDIQSTRSNDFHPDDIELFTTLADQVAIAIYNNQLYVETLHALAESQNVHRQYLQSEWAQDTARRKVLGYLFNQSGISPQQVENPLWKKVFNSGDPVYAVLPGTIGSPDKAVMVVPISVRGETIGVIHVQDQSESGRAASDGFWSEDEIAVVNSIANQVAVALENARLFENTVRRAEREKKVLQITAKIRSTNDPEEMMRVAVGELQQALNATRTQIYIRQEGEE